MRAIAVGLLLSLCATAEAAPLPEEKLKAARAHFDAGEKAFQAGDYRVAADEYLQSYQFYPAPLLLFDLGQAYRLKGEPEKALSFYRRFVETAPTGKYLEIALDKMKELERLLAANAKAARSAARPTPRPPSPAPAPPDAAPSLAQSPTVVAASPSAASVPPSPAARPRRRWWVWPLAVAGVLVVAGGVTAAVVATTPSDAAVPATSAAGLPVVGAAGLEFR